MSKDQIKDLIAGRLPEAGLVDTALKGVQLFRVTEAMPCVPAVYEPTVVAILSGTKEAVLDGKRHAYGSDKYLLCPMTIPVEAGMDLSRFSAAPITHLCGLCFEGQGAFPAQS